MYPGYFNFDVSLYSLPTTSRDESQAYAPPDTDIQTQTGLPRMVYQESTVSSRIPGQQGHELTQQYNFVFEAPNQTVSVNGRRRLSRHTARSSERLPDGVESRATETVTQTVTSYPPVLQEDPISGRSRLIEYTLIHRRTRRHCQRRSGRTGHSNARSPAE